LKDSALKVNIKWRPQGKPVKRTGGIDRTLSTKARPSQRPGT
jgi:hypothetical protein